MKPALNALYTEVRQMVDQLAAGDEAVKSWVSSARQIESVTKLPGDASTRKYYRLTAQGGTTYILMKLDPFPEKRDQLDFIEVQKHLIGSGIDVPQILETDADRGFILLEDLGDVTLLRKLQEVTNPDIERHLYEQVIDSLVLLQVKASESPGKPIDAFNLFFDHKKLMWEVNFTIEHFYQTYLGRTLSDADLKTMVDGFSEICTFLASQPTVLTHRDFHSRNVMVSPVAGGEDRLVMIDFQDARMGPAQYDLASLLKDSYYQLEEAQISRLLDYYIARFEALSNQKLDRAKFREVFDMMSVQRNFKAIGSFASFLNRRGNATYLKYIGNTFENIRRTLLKYPRYSNLREVLFHYYYF
jgi:aminoglycoside/choline kinase family phosphotransferase